MSAIARSRAALSMLNEAVHGSTVVLIALFPHSNDIRQAITGHANPLPLYQLPSIHHWPYPGTPYMHHNILRFSVLVEKSFLHLEKPIG